MSYRLSLWFKKLLCCLSVKLTVTECFLNLHVDKARPCKVAMAHSLFMMWPAICEAMTTGPSPSQNPLSRCYLANRSVHAPQQGSIDSYCLKAPYSVAHPMTCHLHALSVCDCQGCKVPPRVATHSQASRSNGHGCKVPPREVAHSQASRSNALGRFQISN